MSGRISDVTLLMPDVRRRVAALLEAIAKDLPTLRVFESVRAPSRQEALWRRGRDPAASDYGRTVTKARAYQSAHQFGMAVDLVFNIGGEWSWSEPEKGAWDLVHEAARKVALEPLSFEKPHVQAVGFSWAGLSRGPMDDDGWMHWLEERIRSDDEVTAPLRIV